MDYSLGALLAQNNDLRREQVIYYLSRIMIEAEHRYNPVEKECLALVFAQKMQILLGRLVYSCHLQSQSFKIAHDKTLIAKRSIDEMGYIALAI